MEIPIMAFELVRYTAARKALAEAKRVDEAKEIHNQAVAMQVYAEQAKDGRLIGMATEIRKRAVRRIGQLMKADREAGKLAKAGRHPKNRVFQKPDSLKTKGIDKNLADRARKAEAMSDEKHEEDVERAVKIAVAATEGHQAVVAEARKERHEAKKKKRDEREQELTKKIAALPKKKYGVIVADPEWKFEFWSAKGKTNSSADNHYITSHVDKIKERDVPSISADNCVLFLWATVPMLPQALEVINAWGFKYVSNFVWVKNKPGTGYWNRNRHEHLLIGTRGKPPAPSAGTQWDSVIESNVGKHSAKPEDALKMIESYFPTLPKIELNRRGPARKGWDAWGNEAT
jgi:N6-adenosine-specific RNA methylase IME4